jgi:hypothetical protein
MKGMKGIGTAGSAAGLPTPALEADLDLSGGVAEGAIRAFLDLFEESLRAFAAWIEFE